MSKSTTQTLTHTDNIFLEKTSPSLNWHHRSVEKKNLLSNCIVCYYYKTHVCTDFHSCSVPVPHSSHAFPCARTVDLKSLCFDCTLGEHKRILVATLCELYFSVLTVIKQKSEFKKNWIGWVSSFSSLDCVSSKNSTIRLRKIHTKHVHFSHDSLQCLVSITSLWPAHNHFKYFEPAKLQTFRLFKLSKIFLAGLYALRDLFTTLGPWQNNS